jgi:hypothetical protein
MKKVLIIDDSRTTRQQVAAALEGEEFELLCLAIITRSCPPSQPTRFSSWRRTLLAHSLRGFHSTVATERGATGRAVADALGHTSFERITARHYLAPGTRERAEAKRVQRVLAGAESGELPSKFSSPQGSDEEPQQPRSHKNSRDYN